MPKAGSALKLKNNMRVAEMLITKPVSVGELSIKLNVTYNQANWLVFKMLKKGKLTKCGKKFKLSDKHEEILPMPIFVERKINDEVITITRNDAKNLLMGELLEVWQPLAAISMRCGIDCRTAKNILDELQRDMKVKSNTFRLDGHNRSLSYKLTTYLKIMNMIVPVESNNEFVL